MRTDEIMYFGWLSDLVCEERYSDRISYEKLLTFLYNTEFRYSIPMDRNRASDGINLRRRYSLEIHDDFHIRKPCSILEMMIALAIRIEEDIMDNPNVGNRTGQWFWGMVTSLGLGSFYDSRFDEDSANDIIEDFLDHNYKPDGRGGLFTVRNCDIDLRDEEIWTQMCYYLDTIT